MVAVNPRLKERQQDLAAALGEPKGQMVEQA